MISWANDRQIEDAEQYESPNQTLKLTGAAISVSREIKLLQAAPAGEFCR